MLVGTAVSLGGVLLATTWWQLVALRVVLGLVAGGLPTLAYAASANLVPSSRRGAVVGMASSASLLGWAVAPILSGLLVGFDPRTVFVMNLLLVMACAAALAWSSATPSWRSLAGGARERLASLSR
jgi:MFS family permease